MDKFMEIVSWVGANWQSVLGAITAILTGVIGICLLIPGDIPEKQLQAVVDFIAKFSKK